MSLLLNTDDPVWYVAYGSNMSAARFDCYLSGGRPVGGSRTYEGCRDPSAPRADEAALLDGGLYFAAQSRVWGGGIAFYDPDANGAMAARAYLVTFGQLSDVAAQEARLPVGTDLPMTGHEDGRWVLETRTYESVIRLADRRGVPAFTLTSIRGLEPKPPSAPYLRTLLVGLDETFGWSVDERVAYLLRAAGVAPTWTAEALAALC